MHESKQDASRGIDRDETAADIDIGGRVRVTTIAGS
jgi:hypothetical protein